ncbi:hypothetical protein Poly41_35720 [Novipirellula artificiosorum]|uniref:Uncharacterized protein n=1 Tax=Novipirellula artificiosorum TaxID=2528016 RepID=A0A5C6DP70_9BACT|nr:hypothetical protein Poly41_35720 [Novipirellula artificiosorum]
MPDAVFVTTWFQLLLIGKSLNCIHNSRKPLGIVVVAEEDTTGAEFGVPCG